MERQNPDGRWHLDPDNVLRRLMPTGDWLVANGYLILDTAAHVRWLPIVTVVGESTSPLSIVRLTITHSRPTHLPSPTRREDRKVP